MKSRAEGQSRPASRTLHQRRGRISMGRLLPAWRRRDAASLYASVGPNSPSFLGRLCQASGPDRRRRGHALRSARRRRRRPDGLGQPDRGGHQPGDPSPRSLLDRSVIVRPSPDRQDAGAVERSRRPRARPGSQSCRARSARSSPGARTGSSACEGSRRQVVLRERQGRPADRDVGVVESQHADASSLRRIVSGHLRPERRRRPAPTIRQNPWPRVAGR
jgi:hypothetical protein